LKKIWLLSILIFAGLDGFSSDSKYGFSFDLGAGYNQTFREISTGFKPYISYNAGFNAYYKLGSSSTFIKSGIYFNEKSEISRDLTFVTNFGTTFATGDLVLKYQSLNYNFRVIQFLGDSMDFFFEMGPSVGGIYKAKQVLINASENAPEANSEFTQDLEALTYGVDIGMGYSIRVKQSSRINLGLIGHAYQMKFNHGLTLSHLGLSFKSELVHFF